MKKITIIYILFLTTLSINLLQAQNLPNANFENWTDGMFSEPVSWKTLNTTMAGRYSGITTTQSKDAYSDTLAVQLLSKRVNPRGMPINFEAPGVLTLGRIDIDYPLCDEMKVFGGLQITTKPQSLKGFLKFFPVDSIKDSALITFYSMKYFKDSIKIYQDSMKYFKDSMSIHKDSMKYILYSFKVNYFSLYPDTIAVGQKYFTQAITNFQPFEVPIKYIKNEQADTMNIIIMSSTFNGAGIGYMLIVDSLWLDTVTVINSIEKPDLHTSLIVYPNPATSHLYIKNNNVISQPSLYKIFNLLGGLVQSYSLQSTSENVYDMDVSSLTNGIYLLEYTQEGKIQHKKIVINK